MRGPKIPNQNQAKIAAISFIKKLDASLTATSLKPEAKSARIAQRTALMQEHNIVEDDLK